MVLWMVLLIRFLPFILSSLIGLLKSHGKLVVVGAPEKPLELSIISLILGKHMKIYILYFPWMQSTKTCDSTKRICCLVQTSDACIKI